MQGILKLLSAKEFESHANLCGRRLRWSVGGDFLHGSVAVWQMTCRISRQGLDMLRRESNRVHPRHIHFRHGGYGLGDPASHRFQVSPLSLLVVEGVVRMPKMKFLGEPSQRFGMAKEKKA